MGSGSHGCVELCAGLATLQRCRRRAGSRRASRGRHTPLSPPLLVVTSSPPACFPPRAADLLPARRPVAHARYARPHPRAGPRAGAFVCCAAGASVWLRDVVHRVAAGKQHELPLDRVQVRVCVLGLRRWPASRAAGAPCLCHPPRVVSLLVLPTSPRLLMFPIVLFARRRKCRTRGPCATCCGPTPTTAAAGASRRAARVRQGWLKGLCGSFVACCKGGVGCGSPRRTAQVRGEG